ncbi:phytanoyl-CoA dioxygenase family protein [Paenibacillus sp. FSL M8-0212]|uniref:phytanoyl-CoA dioxygenase family protein n=1 Tax=Paenibacillus sp. FSL M8-0212 TaxID=2921618 RepID=UPI0030FCCA10
MESNQLISANEIQGWRNSFFQEGFVLVKNILDENTISQLKNSFIRLMSKVDDDPISYKTRYTLNSQTDKDTWGVNNIFDFNLYEESFGEIYNVNTVMQILTSILGDELRFWGAHALWAPKKSDYELRWHRDYGDNSYYNPTGESNHVQFNIPLVKDSCFIAIAGSHKRQLTVEEQQEVDNDGTKYFDNQVRLTCEPGDILFMNAHTLHRGSCSAGTERMTLHYSIQAKDQNYGGHTSFGEMRLDGYLDRMNPNVRVLMENLIEWDNNHKLSVKDAINQMRIKKEIELYNSRKKSGQ